MDKQRFRYRGAPAGMTGGGEASAKQGGAKVVDVKARKNIVPLILTPKGGNSMLRHLRKMKKDNKGFTLIELMIVVAIIGILAAVAIPQFKVYRQRAFNTAGQSDLKTFQSVMEADFADNHHYQVFK